MRGSIIATLVMAVMIPNVTAGGGRKKTPCDSCTDVYNTCMDVSIAMPDSWNHS